MKPRLLLGVFTVLALVLQSSLHISHVHALPAGGGTQKRIHPNGRPSAKLQSMLTSRKALSLTGYKTLRQAKSALLVQIEHDFWIDSLDTIQGDAQKIKARAALDKSAALKEFTRSLKAAKINLVSGATILTRDHNLDKVTEYAKTQKQDLICLFDVSTSFEPEQPAVAILPDGSVSVAPRRVAGGVHVSTRIFLYDVKSSKILFSAYAAHMDDIKKTQDFFRAGIVEKLRKKVFDKALKKLVTELKVMQVELPILDAQPAHNRIHVPKAIHSKNILRIEKAKKILVCQLQPDAWSDYAQAVNFSKGLAELSDMADQGHVKLAITKFHAKQKWSLPNNATKISLKPGASLKTIDTEAQKSGADIICFYSLSTRFVSGERKVKDNTQATKLSADRPWLRSQICCELSLTYYDVHTKSVLYSVAAYEFNDLRNYEDYTKLKEMSKIRGWIFEQARNSIFEQFANNLKSHD